MKFLVFQMGLQTLQCILMLDLFVSRLLSVSLFFLRVYKPYPVYTVPSQQNPFVLPA